MVKKKWAERFTEEVLFPKAVCQNTGVSYLEHNFCVLMSSIIEQSNFRQITLFSDFFFSFFLCLSSILLSCYKYTEKIPYLLILSKQDNTLLMCKEKKKK